MNFQIQDNASLLKYYTGIPNIVLDLNLDPYEIRLYLEIKRISGETGTCFASNTELCKRTGMKLTKLNEVKKKLASPRDDLNGDSLISLKERKKANGEPDTTLLVINDIWPQNMQKYSKKGGVSSHDIPHLMKGGGMSPRDRGMSPRDRGMSPHDTKEKPYKKNHIKKEYTAHPNEHAEPLSFKVKEIKETLQKELFALKPDRKPITEKQSKNFLDPLIKQHNGNIERIKKVIEWVFHSKQNKAEFWRDVIQGPQSLYRNFDQIEVQMNQKSTKEREKEKAKSELEMVEKHRDWANRKLLKFKFKDDRIIIPTEYGVDICNGKNRQPWSYKEPKFIEYVLDKFEAWGYRVTRQK